MKHFKKQGTTETGLAWRLLLTATGYKRHFSENELYSLKKQK